MWPPVEEGVLADELFLLEELLAPSGLLLFEMVERVKAAVDQYLVGQRPQPFGRLELGAVRRQEHKGETLGHFDFLTAVPSRSIDDQQYRRRFADVVPGGKLAQDKRECLAVDPRGQPPKRLSRFGFDKAMQVAPLVARFHPRHTGRATLDPHAPQHGLQSQAVFIKGPHASLGMLLTKQTHLLFELFLNASWSCKSALACKGGGLRHE